MLEKGAIGLVILQTEEIKVYALSFGIYFLYTGVQEKGAIGLVVLQTAEVLGLIIICFAIHFLCVTIE